MLKISGFNRIKALCDIFDINNIEYNLYILGKAYKEEIGIKIKDLFADNPNIKFLGYKENPYKYIKNMNYLVLLSDREANPLVIEEAFILEVPCIATDFDAAKYQVNETNGIIMPRDITKWNDQYVDAILNNKYNIKQKDYTKNLKQWVGIIDEL